MPVSAAHYDCPAVWLSDCPAVCVKVAGSRPRGTGAPVEAGDQRLCSFSFPPMMVLLPENLCCPGPLGPQSCSPTCLWVVSHFCLPGTVVHPPFHLTPPLLQFQSTFFKPRKSGFFFSCLVLSSSEIGQTYLHNAIYRTMFMSASYRVSSAGPAALAAGSGVGVGVPQ